MKRVLSVVMLTTVLSISVKAQKGSDYNTAVGLHVDVGTGSTWVGPAVKHFFNHNSAGQAELLFASAAILIGAEYQYNGDIQNASGLKWYAGIGPSIAFYTVQGGGVDLILRPVVGLDYKINNVPLNFAFDWRPAFVLTHGTNFEAGRFGLGFRYAF